MTAERGIVVTRFTLPEIAAVDEVARLFGSTRAELLHDVAMTFVRGISMVGPPPTRTLGDLQVVGRWQVVT